MSSEGAATPESAPEKKSGATTGRDKAGRFVQGVSGNPAGKPPETPERKEVRDIAAGMRPANMARLEQLRDHSTDEWLVFEVIRLLLSYSDGKPVTTHVGGPLVNVTVNTAPVRTWSSEECLRYVTAGVLPPDQEREAIDRLQREAQTVKGAIEVQPVPEPERDSEE